MNYDKLICDLFFIDDWHFNKSNLEKYKSHYKRNNKYQNLIEYINTRYNDSLSFKETLYRIKYNINIRPICKTCGNPVLFIGKSGVLFRSFCCNSCSAKNKDTILKKQESDKQKHNGKLAWNKNTKLKKKHRKETLINKYGSWENACKELEILRQQGVYNKYGTNNLMTIEQIKHKHFLTLQQNNSFNVSKSEDESYLLLKEKYQDVIRQYKSDLYPFACDFYIPSLDLFIECNYHWTHGYHPYNSNSIEDQNKIELWKSKHTKYYDNAIKTWTDLDIRKRNVVKENKLNYIIFWNINELKNWLNN